MSDMREYAAQHGWEVGSHLRYAGDVGPSSVITAIEANEVRISTPGDFPGRLTGGSSGLEKWTLDWQYRAEKAEAAIKRVRDVTVPVPGDVYDLDSYTRGAADALALTNKALDGGSSTVLPPLPSTPLDQNPVCPACGGTLALERNRVVCLSDEVNHYWYWDGSDDSPNCGVCDEQWPCAASAEAAIARVREKPYLNARPHGQPEPWREGYNQALREVLRALDGDA